MFSGFLRKGVEAFYGKLNLSGHFSVRNALPKVCNGFYVNFVKVTFPSDIRNVQVSGIGLTCTTCWWPRDGSSRLAIAGDGDSIC
jgi:hypothetical protein